MKAIFKPSLYDNPNKYFQEIEAEESVILMRSIIYKINQRILKKGGRYTHIDPSFRYIREHIKNDHL